MELGQEDPEKKSFNEFLGELGVNGFILYMIHLSRVE
jgi:hypothetical protein